MYLGDFAEDASVNIHFTTHAADGSPVAPSAAFVPADFRIYKNGSEVEKTSSNGISVTSPFDSVTGRHLIAIDTSNDTADAGFWITGADYRLEINSAKTIDGVSQSGVVLATFSVQNRYMRGTNGANATAPDNAGITAIKTIADKLATAIQVDGASGWQFTTLALANGPVGGGGGGDATQAKQDAIIAALGVVDGIVDDIQAVTQQMTFTVANQLDVHVVSMATDSLTSDAAAADFIGAAEIASSASAEIADLIAADWVAGDASPIAIAAAVRTNLAAELALIDAAISSRLASAGYTAPPTASTIATQVDSTLGTSHGAGSWTTADVSGVPTATRDLILAGDKTPIVMASGEVAATLSSTASDTIAAGVALALRNIQLSVQTQLTLSGTVDLRVIQGDDYTRAGVRIDLDTASLPDPDEDLSLLKLVIAAQSSPVIAVRMPIEGAPGSHYVVFDPPSSITELWPVGRFNLLYRLEWAANEYQTLNATGVLTIDPFDVNPSDIVDI